MPSTLFIIREGGFLLRQYRLATWKLSQLLAYGRETGLRRPGTTVDLNLIKQVEELYDY